MLGFPNHLFCVNSVCLSLGIPRQMLDTAKCAIGKELTR